MEFKWKCRIFQKDGNISTLDRVAKRKPDTKFFKCAFILSSSKSRSNNEEKEHNRTLPFCVTRIDSETIDVNNVAHGKC